MFRNEYRRKYDGIAPDPAFRRQLEERMDEMKNPGYIRKRKLTIALAAALVALLALTTGALATGALQSIFTKYLTEDQSQPEFDFAAIDGHSDLTPVCQTVYFLPEVSAEMRLEQSYYNGEQLALGLSLRPTQKLYALNEATFPVGETEMLRTYSFPKWLSEAEQTALQQTFEDKGWAGVAWLDCRLDEGCILPGAVDSHSFETSPEACVVGMMRQPNLAHILCDHVAHWTDDGTKYRFVSYDSMLPKMALGQQRLLFAQTAVGTVHYFTIDTTGYHIGQITDIYASAPFTVGQTDSYLENRYSASAIFPGHTADIELKTTPIQAVLTIRSHVSDLWSTQWLEYNDTEPLDPTRFSEDQLINYALLFDGKDEQTLNAHPGQLEEIMQFIAIPLGTKTLTIRPVYAHSGAHPDEDVAIHLQ